MKARVFATPTINGWKRYGGLGQDETSEDEYNADAAAVSFPTIIQSGYNDITDWLTGETPTSDSTIVPSEVLGQASTNTTNATSAPSTTNVAGAISSLSSAFTNIFKAIQPLPAGCTQVAGPYGTSTQCVNATTAQSALSLSSLTSGSGGTILLIGGVALLAFMFMGRGK
jgi:hypothetical protein